MTNRTIMRIAERSPIQARVSFEFFPPRRPEAVEPLWKAIHRLAAVDPAYVSVTYGAGGTTQDLTFRTVLRIVRETGIRTAAHLTCIGASRRRIDAVADAYWQAGVKRIVALRGDPPAEMQPYRPRSDGYAYASDLVAGLRALHPFEIAVAAYPETHPEAASPQADLDNLKRKIDNGASSAVSQFFFDPEVFLRFRDRAVRAGIRVPITPGLIAVVNFRKTAQFARQCGASIPEWLGKLYDGLDEDPKTRNLLAACIAAEQCRVLYDEGVEAFHFYTMNKADLCYAVCRLMGIRDAPARNATPVGSETPAGR